MLIREVENEETGEIEKEQKYCTQSWPQKFYHDRASGKIFM